MAGRLRKRKTYPLKVALELLGYDYEHGYEQAKNGTFPFPAIQISPNAWVVPKEPVDNYLKDGTLPPRLSRRARTKRQEVWNSSNSVNWNYPVPKELHNTFRRVVKNMNKALANPINLEQAKRLAAKEFIDRRPQFLYEDEEKGGTR